MTNFLVTERLKSTVLGSKLSSVEKEKLTSNAFISHEQLINFFIDAKPTSTLLDLLSLTKMNITNMNESLKDRPKSLAFLKSMEILRLKAKEEEYQKLITPSTGYLTLYENLDGYEITPAKAHKELKSQLTTIVNIFISVGSVVYAIWYWTETSWRLEIGLRVLLCLFFGLLILVAEVVVYMGYLNKIEEAKLKERKKKEIKTLIKTLE
ncbi:uncharacterized protein PRCAT00000891001 [Priceomyces carsonii]|uniref:uncharacterized protein n=1 Tax=Priceomyces carsonii TaxID=28549 RepID=UPI002ED9CB8A|nr:unnamed protein product [Priceomyces carsonii]